MQIRGLLVVAALTTVCSSGCGVVFIAGVQGTTSTATKMETVRVDSNPSGATLFEKKGDKYVARGTTPTQFDAEYKRTSGTGLPSWIAWFLGTAIDGGLTYYSYQKYKGVDAGDSKIVPITMLTTMGLVLLLDGIMMSTLNGEVHSTSVELVAKLPKRADASRTISVPAETDVMIDFANGGSTISEAELNRLSIEKADIGSIFVMDLKVAESLQIKLGRTIANVVATELQQFTSSQIQSMSDVNTVLEQDKMKSIASCNEMSCMAEIGRSLGSEYVLSGDIESAGSYLILNLRLVNAQTTLSAGRSSYRVQVQGAPEDALIPGVPVAVEQLVKSIRK